VCAALNGSQDQIEILGEQTQAEMFEDSQFDDGMGVDSITLPTTQSAMPEAKGADDVPPFIKMMKN
jgi:hypothetical protein